MKISIIGSSGFVGGYLKEKFKKNFNVKLINIRKMNIRNLEEADIKKIFSSSVIINCAASLNPKNDNDLFLNEEFLNQLSKLNIKLKRVIIHLSSINVLIKDRLDKYSISKKNSEKLCKRRKNVIILRLPLIIRKKNNIMQNEGNLSSIYNYLEGIKLPIYPMLYPGHLYQPLEIDQLKKKILEIIKLKKKSGIFNLKGKKKLSLWEIFLEIAKIKKKKVLKIHSSNIYNFLPKFIKLLIKKQNNFLQQLASIDHTKY